jgi:hypothetical protein
MSRYAPSLDPYPDLNAGFRLWHIGPPRFIHGMLLWPVVSQVLESYEQSPLTMQVELIIGGMLDVRDAANCHQKVQFKCLALADNTCFDTLYLRIYSKWIVT